MKFGTMRALRLERDRGSFGRPAETLVVTRKTLWTQVDLERFLFSLIRPKPCEITPSIVDWHDNCDTRILVVMKVGVGPH